MPSRSRVDALEVIRKKYSMSQKVSAKDNEYSFYAGANPEIAFEMAELDVMLEAGLIPRELKALTLLHRRRLNLLRKAWFGSSSSEITMLGFLLGMKRKKVSFVTTGETETT